VTLSAATSTEAELLLLPSDYDIVYNDSSNNKQQQFYNDDNQSYINDDDDVFEPT